MGKVKRILRYLLLLLFFALLFFYCLVFNKPAGWLLLLFYLLFICVDLLSFAPALKKIQLTTESRSVTHEGQRIPLQLGIQAHYRFYPWLQISLPRFRSLAPIMLTGYTGNKQTLNIELPVLKRGIYQNLSVALVKQDLFGLFRQRQIRKLTTEIVVLPRVLPNAQQLVWRIEKQLVSQASGENQYAVRNYRPYQAGDSLKLIDWKLTGKQQELMLRELEVAQEAEKVLLFWGCESRDFEAALQVYYSFQLEYVKKAPIQQYLVGEKGLQRLTGPREFASLKPFDPASPPPLPNLRNKQLLIFTPETDPVLSAQVAKLMGKKQARVYTYQQLKKTWESTGTNVGGEEQ